MRRPILMLIVVTSLAATGLAGLHGRAQDHAATTKGAPQSEGATQSVLPLKGAGIVATSSSELSYDKILIWPEGKAVPRSTGRRTDDATRMQIGQMNGKPVFVEVELEEGAASSFDAAAFVAAIQKQDPRIQKCDGTLTCTRVCKSTGPKEACCEWECTKKVG